MPNPISLDIIQGDITTLQVDAIVNAANRSLLGGGGVDGAIHRKAGPTLLEACKNIRTKQGGCDTGQAVITHAGNLPSQYVIHTVGPVWHGGHQHEVEKLASCYTQSLKLAVENNVSSIAFPNISTGVYHFPKAQAAQIAINTVKDFIINEPTGQLQQIIFVCYDTDNLRLYQNLLDSDMTN